VINYNNANRLTSIQNNGATVVSYGVNALGQRIKKTVGANAIGVSLEE
jgi:YD repeat-containing protein